MRGTCTDHAFLGFGVRDLAYPAGQRSDVILWDFRYLYADGSIGPLTALAIEAFAPPMENFKCGRDFAAWLGIVPRQHSSGGKARLGRVSKAGQADIRRLLIIGAMTRLNWLGRKTIQPGSWLARMLERKPKMLVAIALANKMARRSGPC